MKWEQLLSLKKQGDKNIRKRIEEHPERLIFDVDYDRIIFSDSFRSLQDKTQVIPLSKTGFVHTRLTHSLEVSSVGRSLGRSIGSEILRKYPHLQELGYQLNDFGTIVASAALAHDIGNPPFGHSGEKAIGDFFKYKQGKILKDLLTEKEYEDLCSFEGNANGFRILTETRAGAEGGLRLTYATLGAFIKYPKESLPKKPSRAIHDKKYNIFQSEKDFFADVAKELGLIKVSNEEHLRFFRHPLAYLVEAADDICYTIIDFEDGINLGWIPEEKALEFLTKLLMDSKISQDNITQKYIKFPHKQERIAYLRALSIGTLIEDAKRIFLENEEAILNGEFSTSLLERSKYKAQIEDIIDISIDSIYQSPQVIEKEISGYAILQSLLDVYFSAIMNTINGKETSYDELILKSIPKKYLILEDNIYQTIMGIVCYIASLTDTKATELHSKIIGIM
ncbi:MAG: dNTP triphosphohydrolase [Capnocytophaga sp.]|nr:dNTP triphosphohydrolase [Capnocytophaga sp.]